MAAADAADLPQVYETSVLPFWWDGAPYVGQAVHAYEASRVPYPLDYPPLIYIDDGLGAHDQPSILQDYTNTFLDHMAEQGFIKSPKSEPTPTTSKLFIGKLYSSAYIANTTDRLAQLLAVIIATTQCQSLSPKFMQHLQGRLIYNLCHTSSYSAASYIRNIAAYGHWSNGTTIKMSQHCLQHLQHAWSPGSYRVFTLIQRVPNTPSTL